jgi:glycosyltransferase involved in cell wall biosynthesis
MVSVVIPAYNREATIEKAIQSVLCQTYQDFEIIVVDDGSKDATCAIIASLAEKDTRIRYMKHEINISAQAARKSGVAASGGRFIAFLDADDEWYPDKLKKQVEAIESLPGSVGTVHGDCDIYFETSGVKKRYMVPKLSGYVYEKLLEGPGPLYPCLMVKRECFEKIPDAIDPNVPSWQEWDTSINLARKYEFYFIDEPLMVYRRHMGESMSNDFERDIRGYLHVVEKHRDEILRHCGSETLGNHYRKIATRHLRQKDTARAKEFAKRAMKCGVKDSFTRIASFNPALAEQLLRLQKMAICYLKAIKES